MEGSGSIMADASKAGFTLLSGHAAQSALGHDVRCAVRFPLTLSVVVSNGDREQVARTCNVSASGVLFEAASAMRVGEKIHFSLRMPGAVLGTPNDVLVDCSGRVVRCSMSHSQSQIAATIDEYQFVEQ